MHVALDTHSGQQRFEIAVERAQIKGVTLTTK